MGRLVFLMLFFIFLASVGFWAQDQYLLNESKVEMGGELVEEAEIVEINEEVQDYFYGFFAGDSEVRTYENIEVDEIENLLDQNYELLVFLDGSVLDQSRYNFGVTKLVKVSDYDGEFFYSSKYGMEVGGSYIISKRDFEKSFDEGGGMAIGFLLN